MAAALGVTCDVTAAHFGPIPPAAHSRLRPRGAFKWNVELAYSAIGGDKNSARDINSEIAKDIHVLINGGKCSYKTFNTFSQKINTRQVMRIYMYISKIIHYGVYTCA